MIYVQIVFFYKRLFMTMMIKIMANHTITQIGAHVNAEPTCPSLNWSLILTTEP